MTTDRPQRFAHEEPDAPAIAAELDDLRGQLEAEQAAYDVVEGELIRSSGRVKALEQELRLVWARVDMLEQELAYERLPRRSRIVRRRPKPSKDE
jgi:hypothetical protein